MDIAESLHQILESLAPMREAAAGYREKLIEAGWPDHEAARISAELLIAMNRKAFSG